MRRRLRGKEVCREALLKQMNLAPGPRGPVFGMVTRVVQEKGFEILVPLLDRLLWDDVRLIILGEGDPAFETALAVTARKFPTKFAYQKDYDEKAGALDSGRHGHQPDSIALRTGRLGRDVQLEVWRTAGRARDRWNSGDHRRLRSDNGQRLWFSVLRTFKRRFLGRDETGASNLPRPGPLDEADETRDGPQFFVGRVSAAL